MEELTHRAGEICPDGKGSRFSDRLVAPVVAGPAPQDTRAGTAYFVYCSASPAASSTSPAPREKNWPCCSGNRSNSRLGEARSFGNR